MGGLGSALIYRHRVAATQGRGADNPPRLTHKDDAMTTLSSFDTQIQIDEAPDCPYCQEPLGGHTVNGLHEHCNAAFSRELDDAYPESDPVDVDADELWAINEQLARLG